MYTCYTTLCRWRRVAQEEKLEVCQSPQETSSRELDVFSMRMTQISQGAKGTVEGSLSPRVSSSGDNECLR